MCELIDFINDNLSDNAEKVRILVRRFTAQWRDDVFKAKIELTFIYAYVYIYEYTYIYVYIYIYICVCVCIIICMIYFTILTSLAKQTYLLH